MRFLVVVTLASLLAASCSSEILAENAHGVSGTCADPPLAPTAAGSSLEEKVEHDGLAQLDDLFGRVLRKEAIVYRGRMSARSTFGTQHDSLADQPALALLTVNDTVEGDWPVGAVLTKQSASLVVHAQGRHVAVEQLDSDHAAAAATAIIGDDSFTRTSASCVACAPDLFAKPADLHVSIEATGTDAETVVDATLTAVDPCTLSLADFAILDTAQSADASLSLSDFHDDGGVLVGDVSDSQGDASRGHCGTVTTGHAQMFVNEHNLAEYGVRDYHTDSSFECPP